MRYRRTPWDSRVGALCLAEIFSDGGIDLENQDSTALGACFSCRDRNNLTDYRLQINTAFPRVLYSIDTRDTAIHESKLRSWWMVWLATKLIVRTDSLLKACYRA